MGLERICRLSECEAVKGTGSRKYRGFMIDLTMVFDRGEGSERVSGSGHEGQIMFSYEHELP